MKFSKELIIALILAIIVAVAIGYWDNWSNQQAIQHNLKAIATVMVYDRNGMAIGQGSGFFINSSGLLATNYHVIKDAVYVRAKLASGAGYDWQGIKYKDENADITLLQFDARDTPSISGMGNSDNLYTGQKVYAMGTPSGLEGTVSQGNISNPNQNIYGQKLIQFTAPISAGSSGGGLFDDKGKIIGITAAILDIFSGPQAGEAQNLNLAVPINDLKTVIAGNQNITVGSPTFYYSQGNLADNQQKWDEAIANYMKAIQLNDQYVDAYIGLAGDYYEKGQYDLEVQTYLKATQVNPNNSDAFYYLATAYEDAGQYNNAIGAYKESLNIDPTKKEAIHDLAVLYLALGYKSSAVELVPKLTKIDQGWGDKLQLLINNQK